MRLFVFSIIALALGLALEQPSFAIINLKKVQVTDGAQVDLLFDGKVSPNQVQTEFFNDIIQLSLNDVSVYPAKITSVSGTDLTKVFAYQYSPKLVRCRFTVKGKAENYQKKAEIKINGKIISLRIPSGGVSDEIIQTAAYAEKKAEKERVSASTDIKAEPVKVSEEERALLDRVMKSSPPSKEKRGERVEKDAEPTIATKEEPVQAIGRKSLASGKPLPSPWRSFGMLFVVVGLFAAVALVARRVRGKNIQNHKGFAGIIGKFTGLGRDAKMIEVVATHYLGPKKSIAVVRVAGRLLVLGVSNDAINLITQLPDRQDTTAALSSEAAATVLSEEMDLDLGIDPLLTQKPAAPKASPASAGFSDLLNTERAKPSVRAQIRSRVEGMKRL